ncbi:MAG: hemolysin family protein [Phycisphaeraceae bacterium]
MPIHASEGDWALLWFYLALALGFSFLCSLLEAALLSVPRTHVEVLASQGRRSGRILRDMKEDPDRPLAAILTLNTAAHTGGAAGVGAEILVIFGSQWVAVGGIVVTLLILVLSEILPKTIGTIHAKALSGFTAHTTLALVWCMLPIVLALRALSRCIGRPQHSHITREEFRAAADMSAASGVLDPQESRVLRNLLRLDDVTVHDVMTPRSVVFMLPAQAQVDQVVAQHGAVPFTRIPVYDGSPDQIIGQVHRHAILEARQQERGGVTLRELVRPIHVIPGGASVADALDQFIARGEHLFQVVDEHGGTAGIMTLEDAVETLLGVEIVDETDTVRDMREKARLWGQRRREQRGPRSVLAPDTKKRQQG